MQENKEQSLDTSDLLIESRLGGSNDPTPAIGVYEDESKLNEWFFVEQRADSDWRTYR